MGDDYQKLGRDVFKSEEIKKMDYLHAAISKALRLFPSVPVDHKEVTNVKSYFFCCFVLFPSFFLSFDQRLNFPTK